MPDIALGEVIASDSQSLEIECHQLYCAPPFGSFVRADCVGGGLSQFAVVTRVSTGPYEASRVVQAHRMAPGELEQRKPHLTTLLRTTFEARVVGYGQEAARVTGTPPLPVRLHCFVYPATEEEIRDLTRSPAFLRPLTQAPDVPLEDLLVCALDAARKAHGSDALLVSWGKYLARLLHKDYVTLESVFQRLSPGAPAPAASSAAPAGKPAAPRWEAPLHIPGSDPFA